MAAPGTKPPFVLPLEGREWLERPSRSRTAPCQTAERAQVLLAYGAGADFPLGVPIDGFGYAQEVWTQRLKARYPSKVL
jgi:hypothetical protein